MANNTSANPMILDTAGEILAPTKTPCVIEWAVWMPTGDGDDLIFDDGAGTQVLAVKGFANTPMSLFPQPIKIGGTLNIDTIDSGTVFMKLR